jgi:hypothetical protein
MKKRAKHRNEKKLKKDIAPENFFCYHAGKE